jgi:Flp pilus assembly protein protease CpaA
MAVTQFALASGWLAAVAWCDWQRLRIPNALVAAAGAALAVMVIAGAHPLGLGAARAFAGAALVLCVGLPLFAKRWVGAGDVKVLAVLGGLLGPGEQLLLVWAGASLLAAAHVVAWRMLQFHFHALPLSPGDPGIGHRRRLAHGTHLALSAAIVLLCTQRPFP